MTVSINCTMLISYRNVNLHPICLPKWDPFDVDGNPTIDKLYKPFKWENHQILYSLKAIQRDVRFTSVWTDVNGPDKFVVINQSILIL